MAWFANSAGCRLQRIGAACDILAWSWIFGRSRCYTSRAAGEFHGRHRPERRFSANGPVPSRFVSRGGGYVDSAAATSQDFLAIDEGQALLSGRSWRRPMADLADRLRRRISLAHAPRQ